MDRANACSVTARRTSRASVSNTRQPGLNMDMLAFRADAFRSGLKDVNSRWLEGRCCEIYRQLPNTTLRKESDSLNSASESGRSGSLTKYIAGAHMRSGTAQRHKGCNLQRKLEHGCSKRLNVN